MATSSTLLLLLTLAVAPAGELGADEPVEQTADAAPVAGALEQGKQLYFGGEVDAALELLSDLRDRVDAGEEVADAVRAELYVWLGEIQYHLGLTDDARASFRALLLRDPEYAISPYAHPLEVVGEFELVRREVLDEREQRREVTPEIEGPGPAPAWIWAPLGIPQFAQRRVGAGLVFGGLQLGLGAVSLGMFVHLDRHNRDPATDGLPPSGMLDEEVRPWVDRHRYRVQWPATFAFYGVWLASSLEARRHWRRTHGPTVTLGPLPRGGSGVLVRAEF